jgi:hypothetical protein
VGLLLVLAGLVLGVTAATIAAQVALTAHRVGRLDRAQVVVDDVAASTERRIERWLVERSASAVAPVDAAIPAIGLVDETIRLDEGRMLLVRVTAFDQRGMLPWDAAIRSDPIASLLSERVREAVRAAHTAGDVPLGLDLFPLPTEAMDVLVWPSHASVLPADAPRSFGAPRVDASEGSGRIDRGAGDAGADSIGSQIGTHCRGRAAINVNTAPRPLIALAEQLLQRSVWDKVALARAEGRAVTDIGAASTVPVDLARSGGEDESTPTLIVGSDVWSFRIDATLDAARSAWWVTYTRSDRGWVLAQRLRVLE